MARTTIAMISALVIPLIPAAGWQVAGGQVAGQGQIHAAEKRPGAFIISPREGASVGRTSKISGKTFLRGQPLALVRASDGDGPWWVQRTIQRNDRGQLQGKVQFGNALAKPGTPFEVVVVVVQTPLELEFFTQRESLDEIPDNVPKSAIRKVVYGKSLVKPSGADDNKKPQEDSTPADDPSTDQKPDAGKPPTGTSPANPPPPGDKPGATGTKPAANPDTNKTNTKKTTTTDKGQPPKLGLAILKPLAGAKVGRIEQLVGRVESDDDAPIVLVRAEGDTQWWVQEKVVFGDGKYFKTKLRFGNDKTPEGTRFMILVVSPRPGPETQAMQAGAAFAVLPRGIRRSQEVIVRRGSPEPPEEAK